MQISRPGDIALEANLGFALLRLSKQVNVIRDLLLQIIFYQFASF